MPLTFRLACAARDSLSEVFDADGQSVTVVFVCRTTSGPRVTYVDQSSRSHTVSAESLTAGASLLAVFGRTY